MVINNRSNADPWDQANGGTSYAGTTWANSAPGPSFQNSVEWHLGTGLGAGAEVANVEASYVALGTSCLFQVSAEVFTAAS